MLNSACLHSNIFESRIKNHSKFGHKILSAHARLFGVKNTTQVSNGGSVKMALLRDAVFKKFPRMQELLQIEKSKINLQPLKKVTIRFDPFNNDVWAIRKFAHSMYENKIVATNNKCFIKTEILTDRSESHVVFDLTNGKQFIFKCKNLKLLEIFQLMNEHITSLAQKEDLEIINKKMFRK